MKVINLGAIDYLKAYEFQLETVEAVRQGGEETLIICSHPAVVTLGKKSTPTDILGWSGPIHQIERGGKATYHGPGQVVIYPIVNLKNHGQDISGYLNAMESAMIEALQTYGIESKGNEERGKPDYTGVWTVVDQTPRKIASIGIAVKRWITFHGLALNLYHDPLAFSGINPCGFSTSTMTNLEELLGEKLERVHFEEVLSSILQSKIESL